MKETKLFIDCPGKHMKSELMACFPLGQLLLLFYLVFILQQFHTRINVSWWYPPPQLPIPTPHPKQKAENEVCTPLILTRKRTPDVFLPRHTPPSGRVTLKELPVFPSVVPRFSAVLCLQKQPPLGQLEQFVSWDGVSPVLG